MKTNRHNAGLLRNALERWVKDGTLTPEKAEELNASITEVPYDWHKITRIAFTVALICGLASFIYLLADKLLLELFYKIINAPYPLLCAIFALLSGLTYYFTWRMPGHPNRVYSREALLLGAGAMAGAAIYFLGRSLSPELPHYAPLFLVGAVLWLVLGHVLPSPSTWVVGCLCLIIWYGTETAYINGDSPLFLGMNLPLRYLPFSIVLLGVAQYLRRLPWPPFYLDSSWLLALLLFFSSLWLLSIIGNQTDWSSWQAVSGWTFAPYSLLLGVISAGAVYFGARLKDSYLRGVGILYFLLNLYTKFIEHGWPNLHGALFFLILALSFWWIGRRAEKLWEMTGN